MKLFGFWGFYWILSRTVQCNFFFLNKYFLIVIF